MSASGFFTTVFCSLSGPPDPPSACTQPGKLQHDISACQTLMGSGLDLNAVTSDAIIFGFYLGFSGGVCTLIILLLLFFIFLEGELGLGFMASPLPLPLFPINCNAQL